MGAKVNVRSIVDTFVRSDKPTISTPTSTRLYVGDGFRSLLFWSNPISMKSKVKKAVLHVQVGNDVAASVAAWKNSTVTLRLAAKAWSVNTVNWGNQPGFAGAATTFTCPAAVSVGDWLDIDIMPLMQLVANGQTWQGLYLTATGAMRSVYSMDCQQVNRPWVELEWSTPPATPTGLSPSGVAAIISTPKPILTFDYMTGSGYEDLSAINVQIATDSSFTNIAHDSGWFATSLPQYDVGATNFSLTAGTSYYWRARARDDSGQETPFSAYCGFVYRALNSVTLTNPDQTKQSPYVEDNTPPISWTSSTTQQHFQVLIYYTDGTQTSLVHDSGKITSTNQTYTPPSGVIRLVNSTYMVTVRVWDTYNRQVIGSATGSAPNYASSSLRFVYKYNLNVSPVSSITLEKSANDVYANIVVVRAAAPDSFTLIRNDKVVQSNILPSDVRDASDSTKYKIRDMPAGRADMTWQVIAVVNNVSSASNPVLRDRFRRKVSWITDQNGNNPVALTNLTTSFESGDLSSVVEPLGGSPVLVTQQLGNERGTLEADISGSVIPGLTAKTMKESLEYIRKYQGGVCKLLFADEAWNGFFFNLGIDRVPTGDGLTDYHVSMSFYQVGDL